jgi:hypothetical protein
MIMVDWPRACKLYMLADRTGYHYRRATRGVYVDPAGYMVATNGYALAVVPVKITGDTDGFRGALIPH